MGLVKEEADKEEEAEAEEEEEEQMSLVETRAVVCWQSGCSYTVNESNVGWQQFA
jgi:hypothetical protein